jgi:hypothetical protein
MTLQSSATTDSGRHQRSAKNYLIDPRFQLKYTALLVAVALFLSTALGLLLWNTSSQVIRQSQRAVQEGRETVKQGQATIERGQQVIKLSRKVSQVVAMNIAKEYAGDPELAKTFSGEAQKDEAQLRDEQAKLERDAAYLNQRDAALGVQAEEVAHQQTALLTGLVAALVLLVGAIGFAGILVTHRVAGPIFKMKRLLGQVGEGRLVLRERLRKGDELQHFFDAFEGMVAELRAQQEARVATVDAILASVDAAPRASTGEAALDQTSVTRLRQLRSDLQAQLES